VTVALERAQNGLMEDPNEVSCATFLVEENKRKERGKPHSYIPNI
jgi:hypothetical protein